MALSALIHKSKTVPVATLTVATIATQDTETRPTVAKVATVTVANLPKSKIIQTSDRQKLLAYLESIGETDQDIIDEYLTECGKDAAILARELQQADDCLQIEKGNHTGLMQCAGCSHLSGDTCNRHGWRVVVDKWRRCADYAKSSAIITCKSCGHFQSFNDHGGGAGTCDAGVQPFGVCWWADTLHECEKFDGQKT